MKCPKEYTHLIAALLLGMAFGASLIPPLVGYLVAMLAGLALHKAGLLNALKEAVEYVGLLAISWTIVATLLHYP
ncbi:MAG: hypothetical protein QXY49_00695 [Thermofilaceae archaeon]